MYFSIMVIVLSSIITLSSSYQGIRNFKNSYKKRSFSCSLDLNEDKSNLSIIEQIKLISNDNKKQKHELMKNTLFTMTILSSTLLLPSLTKAIETIEDNIFTSPTNLDSNDNLITSEPYDPIKASEFSTNIQKNRPLNTDEFIVNFENKNLGLGLMENFYKGFPVVTISSIKYPLNDENDKAFRVSYVFSCIFVYA